jgi:cysteine desulfurase
MTIYLDHAATTPVDARVAAAMSAILTSRDAQANAASSTHGAGLAVAARVAAARASVAALVGAQPHEIVFTSGATESNNLALLGVARAASRAGKRGHLVSSRAEHKSVLDALKQLGKDGFDVTLLDPDEQGRVPPEAVRTALRDDTLLVSIMLANNEIGSINDVAAIGAVCRARGVPLHTDAAQAVGKIPVDVARLDVDFLSLTAHKIYGPKGIGALFVRETARPKIAPVSFGGGHERGLRSGTLATHQIVGFAAAAELARADPDIEARRQTGLRDRLWQRLAELPGVLRNGAPEQSLPGLLNASFPDVEGESLLTMLTGLAVSSGSACSSATREPSYVLRALGRDTELAQSSLRLSLGRATTEADVDAAACEIVQAFSRLLVLAGRAAMPGGPSVEQWQAPAPLPDSLMAHALNAEAQRCFRAPPRPRRHVTGPVPPNVRIGRAGRQEDGTVVLFELELSESPAGSDGSVKSARFNAYGCPHTLAVAAWLCEVVEGARLDAGIPGTPADWAAKFEVPVEKLGRLLIVEDALRAAFAA